MGWPKWGDTTRVVSQLKFQYYFSQSGCLIMKRRMKIRILVNQKKSEWEFNFVQFWRLKFKRHTWTEAAGHKEAHPRRGLATSWTFHSSFPERPFSRSLVCKQKRIVYLVIESSVVSESHAFDFVSSIRIAQITTSRNTTLRIKCIKNLSV